MVACGPAADENKKGGRERMEHLALNQSWDAEPIASMPWAHHCCLAAYQKAKFAVTSPRPHANHRQVTFLDMDLYPKKMTKTPWRKRQPLTMWANKFFFGR